MLSRFHTRILGQTLPALTITTAMLLLPGQTTAGEWRVGANLLAAQSPLVGEDGTVALLPVLAYKGEWFYANLGNPGISFFTGSSDFGGVGYHLLKGEDFNIDLVGRIRLMGFDPDDTDELKGLHEREPGFDAGISARWDIGLGELNALLLTDISDRSNGQEVALSYAYPLHQGRWTLRPVVGLSWQSSDLVDYYFGVQSDETTISRPTYEGEATFTPFAVIETEYAFSEQTHLVGGLGVGRLGDGISDSPIIDRRNLAGGYLGLVYRF